MPSSSPQDENRLFLMEEVLEKRLENVAAARGLSREDDMCRSSDRGKRGRKEIEV